MQYPPLSMSGLPHAMAVIATRAALGIHMQRISRSIACMSTHDSSVSGIYWITGCQQLSASMLITIF